MGFNLGDILNTAGNSFSLSTPFSMQPITLSSTGDDKNVVYQVLPKDTFSSIAKNLGVPLETLKAANPEYADRNSPDGTLKGYDFLLPRDQIRVPVAALEKAAASTDGFNVADNKAAEVVGTSTQTDPGKNAAVAVTEASKGQSWLQRVGENITQPRSWGSAVLDSLEYNGVVDSNSANAAREHYGLPGNTVQGTAASGEKKAPFGDPDKQSPTLRVMIAQRDADRAMYNFQQYRGTHPGQDGSPEYQRLYGEVLRTQGELFDRKAEQIGAMFGLTKGQQQAATDLGVGRYRTISA